MATGGNLKEEAPNPPLYQSPQFQNEFPSLDGGQQQQNVPAQMNSSAGGQGGGSGGTGSGQSNQQNSNNKYNSMDINLRPQTDWINQQQQNSGNARGGGAEQQQNYTPDQDLHAVPQKVIALMPSFMLRGNQGGPPPPHHHQGQQHHQQQQQYHGGERGGGNQNYQNQGRPQRQQQHYGGQNYNNNNDYQGRRPPPRMANRRPDQSEDRPQIYEDSVMQRPIIKEEELERIEALSKDDGWAKNDEIDYNQKLQFSDDEALEDMPQQASNKKRDDRKMGNKHEQRYKNDERDQSGEFKIFFSSKFLNFSQIFQ